MNDDNVRGTARFLVGSMLSIGVIVDMFLTTIPHNLFSIIYAIIIFVIGLLLIGWGYIAMNNSIKENK